MLKKLVLQMGVFLLSTSIQKYLEFSNRESHHCKQQTKICVKPCQVPSLLFVQGLFSSHEILSVLTQNYYTFTWFYTTPLSISNIMYT